MFFLVCFFFPLYKVVGIIREYRQIDQFYENANRNFVQLEKRSLPKVDFETLQEVNKDVIAWIYIEDADISFPVLQGKTNKQYLFQSYKKEYLTAGSIFIDYRCGRNFEDKNTVIYGHNMHNGSMFGSLKNINRTNTKTLIRIFIYLHRMENGVSMR